jgi:hypothetical protein
MRGSGAWPEPLLSYARLVFHSRQCLHTLVSFPARSVESHNSFTLTRPQMGQVPFPLLGMLHSVLPLYLCEGICAPPLSARKSKDLLMLRTFYAKGRESCLSAILRPPSDEGW